MKFVSCLFISVAVCYLADAVDDDSEDGPPLSIDEFLESNKIPEETQKEIEAAKKEMENDEDDHEDEINGETDDDRVVVLDLNKEEDRNVLTSASKKWPDNTVPYTISKNFGKPGSKARLYVAKAIQALQRHTCLRFRPATEAEKSGSGGYIHFVREDGCWSLLGYQGDAQKLSLGELGDDGCLYTTTVVHEVMHALGFAHEQSRPDRDQYIRVLTDNISEEGDGQFDIEEGSTTYGTIYDYCSIMQYEKSAFGKTDADGNTMVTMKVLKTDQKCADSLGLTPHLTDQDIRKINQLYQCQDYASIKNTKNTKARLCYDDKSEDYCSEQKRQGYCWGTGETNAQIRFNCQKTCNQCGEKICEDNDDDCPDLISYCNSSNAWMENNCAKTCKKCN